MAAAPHWNLMFAAFPPAFRNSSASCQSSWAGTTKVKRTHHPLRAVVREEQPTCADRTLVGVSPLIYFIAVSPDRAQVCGGWMPASGRSESKSSGPWIGLNSPFLKGEAALLTVKSLILMLNKEMSDCRTAFATVCTWPELKACSARVAEAVWRSDREGQINHLPKTFEIDKLCRSDPLLLCRFQNDILKGVFSTDPVSAVKYFCVGETVWMCSQT